MDIFVLVLEIVGTVSFAMSGALAAVRRKMDIFGVCILGVTTAVGGGVIRDLLLGQTPPAMFRDPIYAAVAIVVSVAVFIPVLRHKIMSRPRVYELFALVTDAVGLGVFAVVGVQAVVSAGHGDNLFFTVFLGTVTGVGGGVLRDVMCNTTPYIFVKHIYACAAIAGALVCALGWRWIGSGASMAAGIVVVIVLRLLAAHFHWSLPKAGDE